MRFYLFSNGAYRRPGRQPLLHRERAATSLGATSGTDVATAYELVSEGVAAGMQTRLTNNAATLLVLGDAPVMILVRASSQIFHHTSKYTPRHFFE